MNSKLFSALVTLLLVLFLTLCKLNKESLTPATPSPPANDTVTNYLETPIKEGTISPDMYISQGYAIFDIENDAYLRFIYFIFDGTNLKAELTLSLQPDDDGWYANSFHIVEKCEIAATLKLVLDNNIPISVVAINNEDPSILLCTKDGWGAVIYPEYNASEAFDVYDARFLPVAAVGAKSIDLTILSDDPPKINKGSIEIFAIRRKNFQ